MQVSGELMKAFTFIGCSVLTAGIFSFVQYVLGWCIANNIFHTDNKEDVKTVMLVVLVILTSVALSTLLVLEDN